MSRPDRTLAFAAFLTSGFCALLYQVIWIRLAFAQFGIIMPVVSVVLSVFMAGNALGSWGGGLLAERLSRNPRPSPLLLYAAAEGIIGIGSLAVPALLAGGRSILLNLGGMDSLPYLLFSALLIGAALLPWCVMMGATYPFMMAFLRSSEPEGSGRSFSFLYLANVVGAMAGAFASAFLLVETLGFSGTLAVGGGLNLAIAFACAWYARKPLPATPVANLPGELPSTFPEGERSFGTVATILFATGFATLALEIVWTRMFTPVLKTSVYAFAGLLIVYLAATWVGSTIYRAHASRGRVLPLSWTLVAAMVTVFLPALINDPRWFSTPAGIAPVLAALSSILPFCLTLGYLTPQLVDEAAKGSPAAAGRLYAINIVGCILGPLAASYLLLPFFGAKGSLALLGIPFVLLFLRHSRGMTARARGIAATAGVLLLAVSATLVLNHEAPYSKRVALVRRDYAATVTCAAIAKGNKVLLVNGVGITNLTPITKHMAHLPLMLLPRSPESGLVICFGMGTTWKSLMSWGIDATAVELVPSVRDVFGYFYRDAGALLADPRGRIVIDDGRRFLMRTDKRFDVITIDPPPPVEASGSSLLYSDEFYLLAKARLKPGGILQQWSPVSSGDRSGPDPTILNSIARPIAEAFPFVRAFVSIEGWGVHFLASDAPIVIPPPEVILERMPGRARENLLEWYPGVEPSVLVKDLTLREIPLSTLLLPDPKIRISDDHPYNEYFLLRRFLRG